MFPCDLLFIGGHIFFCHGCLWSRNLYAFPDALAEEMFVVFDGQERAVREILAVRERNNLWRVTN